MTLWSTLSAATRVGGVRRSARVDGDRGRCSRTGPHWGHVARGACQPASSTAVRLTTVQPYSRTAVQPYSRTAVQPSRTTVRRTAVQPHSPQPRRAPTSPARRLHRGPGSERASGGPPTQRESKVGAKLVGSFRQDSPVECGSSFALGTR